MTIYATRERDQDLRSRIQPAANGAGKMNSWLTEYRRPWKLATLAAGIGLLILGSSHYQAPDWDIPISFIMAILAYLTAPWSLRVILERQWRRWR